MLQARLLPPHAPKGDHGVFVSLWPGNVDFISDVYTCQLPQFCTQFIRVYQKKMKNIYEMIVGRILANLNVIQGPWPNLNI